jgi:hypothetical protein
VVAGTDLNMEAEESPLFGCQSQSQSYFTTGSIPPITSSWRQALETNDK